MVRSALLLLLSSMPLGAVSVVPSPRMRITLPLTVIRDAMVTSSFTLYVRFSSSTVVSLVTGSKSNTVKVNDHAPVQVPCPVRVTVYSPFSITGLGLMA